MSVATRNPFALLEDDSPPSAAPAAAPKQAASTPAPASAARTNQKPRGGPASRGGRYYPRGGKAAAQNGEVAADDAAEAPRKRFEGEGRGRGRGRGRGGDRGGDRGRGARRPFDRHSATGKTDSDKKVHQGWGGDEPSSELKAEAAGENDAQAEASTPAENAWGPDPAAVADAWGAPEGETAAPAEGEKADSRPRREVEEEDNTLTLEEYLKQQAEKQLEIVPKLEARQANEGDDSIWKGAVAVTKKTDEDDAYFVGKTKANAPKTRAKKEEKVYLEIDARFERPQRGGRGRGGDRPPRGPRGGARGSRGRGSANGNGNSSALNVDDQTAFPSLA